MKTETSNYIETTRPTEVDTLVTEETRLTNALDALILEFEKHAESLRAAGYLNCARDFTAAESHLEDALSILAPYSDYDAS